MCFFQHHQCIMSNSRKCSILSIFWQLIFRYSSLDSVNVCSQSIYYFLHELMLDARLLQPAFMILTCLIDYITEQFMSEIPDRILYYCTPYSYWIVNGSHELNRFKSQHTFASKRKNVRHRRSRILFKYEIFSEAAVENLLMIKSNEYWIIDCCPHTFHF